MTGPILRRPDGDELPYRIVAGDVIELDIRPRPEFAAGHIAGARSIPIEQFAESLKALPRGERDPPR